MRLRTLLGVGAVFLASGVLSGCVTPQMDIPDTRPPPHFETIGVNENVSTFALAKLVNDIKRGEDIFAFPSMPTTNGTLCNHRYGSDAVYTYAGGRSLLGNWSSELGIAFHETLTDMGYDVAGDPNNLFEANLQAEYMIAGRLLDMKGNFCHEHHWWDGHALKTYSGEMYVEFEWSVQNTLTKERILKKRTAGYYMQKQPIKAGVSLTFEEAFISSLQKFASMPEMRKLAIGRPISAAALSSTPFGKYVIKNGPKTAMAGPKQAMNNLVMIRIGGGHGSGFFVGKDGYILTNAHVVGGAKNVQVVTSSGISVQGEVIEVHKKRDVALIKSPLQVSNALHLRTITPDIGDDVYALGAPMRESFHNTMTKGIVSAYRIDRASGLKFLQSDTPISPGNSGGPLVNSKGQVVAISVAKWTEKGADNLGFFIPIPEALKYLSIKLK